MLELYHSINSVCAQKVRIALKEKGQEANDHIMTLRGDQHNPAYLQLNPNGVVPTLVHDGKPIMAGRNQQDAAQAAAFPKMTPEAAPSTSAALEHHRKFLSWMADSLKGGLRAARPWSGRTG
jgi:glutathione S-transferase